ncbi:arabinose metabolism transcriptional repressor [Tepiditoga spiralis]|uniref:Arabinose metabolism transcriptional repressor n=1 Tax=Tepiditoga spiralis TaxID=2108365 RepID=A0A7G1G4N9_9BACT|nr:GntR family transcriptional regulator [Tepiditoga spiralis]BBE31498.1 arabinose metabolism transcriptional repressor [Tepiditoga spiralis]
MEQSNKPLYIKIKEYILKNINNGTFKPGEVIPTERSLSENLKVSRQTIRKAIQELVYAGYLYRVQGAGTFVFDKSINSDKKNNHIGVLLNNCSDEFESKILNGIEKALEEKGFSITFMNSNENYKKEAENIHKLKHEGVAGMIIMPAEDQKDSNAISDLKEEQFPFVLVDRRLQGCETDVVMSDNIDGTFKATNHLIDRGHHKIAFIKNRYSITSTIEDRITGYKKAMKNFGFEDEEILLYSYNEYKKTEDQIYEELYKYITENKITGIVALNDYVALHIVKMSRIKNIKIPEDLSVVGFDDKEIVKHLEVPLTTVAQYPKNIGYQAGNLLIKKIEIKNNDELDSKIIHQIYYPTKLIIRNSTKNL